MADNQKDFQRPYNSKNYQLIINEKGNMSTKPKSPLLPHALESEPSLVYPFIEEEYINGIAALKYNKAAGIDDVLVEQLMNPGLRAHKWPYSMLNVGFTEARIFRISRIKIWQQS